MQPDQPGISLPPRSWPHGWWSLCGFAAAVAINSALSELYDFIDYLEQHSVAQLLPLLVTVLLIYFMAAAGMLLALRGRRSSASHLARQPRRFLLILASVAGLVSWLARAAAVSYANDGRLWYEGALDEFVQNWFNAMLWGGTFGWLYILYLQRGEDRMRLAGLQGSRAALARQLAQSELLAARAHIDPAMVAGVLRIADARYAQDPASGAALLEQLIAYLRLALNRKTATMQEADAALAALRAAASISQPLEETL